MTKVEVPFETLPIPAKMPDRVTAALLSLIRKGDYLPGARLPSEMSMAKSFGVSRTVIREAVSRLKSEGLVDSRQGSGVFVRSAGMDKPFRIDPAVADSAQSVLQIVELRRGLESGIAALAAERRSPAQLDEIRAALAAIDADVRDGGDGVDADMAFHQAIARATGNPHFLSLWDFLSQFLRGAMTVTRSLEASQPDMGSQVLDEHRALLEAIVAGDPAAASAAAWHHMVMASRRIGTLEAGALGG